MSHPERPTAERRVAMAVALTGDSATPLRQQLDTTEVVVKVDPAEGPAAILAGAAVVSMSARIVGNVIAPPLPLPQPNPWDARTLPGVVAASRGERPRAPLAGRRLTISIGLGAGRGDVHLGGDDWTAVVSRRGPVSIGRCPLGGPGLQAAAALGFGELVKDLLGPVGMRCVPVEDELVWNLLDGRLAPATVPAEHQRATRPLVALLGVGSVGSSAAAVLSMLPLGGTAEIVDPDRFDPRRNAYRCPGVPATENGSKAEWAARLLRDAGWSTVAFPGPIAEWAAARPQPGFPGLALVSVDNVDGRRDAADLMAATTVSAGIAGSALHVHRHHAVDEYACPYCEFVDARRWQDQAEIYARLGLTVARLQALLDGAPLTLEDVATAIWTGAVDPGAADDLVPGGRLIDLINRHYATVAVRIGEDPTPHRVSAPHVSWLAGTLLAAEVVKRAVGLPGLDRRVEVDLTGVPLGGWRRPPRNPSGRCPCTSPARRDLARSLYDPHR